MKALPLFVGIGCMAATPLSPSFGAEPVRGPKAMPIVVFGDSTTAPRDTVKIYADLLKEELPPKGLAVDISNAGVGGNSTLDAKARFQKDVVARRPALVVIQFGINDSTINVWKKPPESRPPVSKSQFAAHLEYFIDTLHRQHCKVILMTPNPMRWTPALKNLYGKAPYLPNDPDGFNVTLRAYAECVRTVAKKKKVSLVDVYAEFQNYGKQHPLDDLLLDGMHPNDQGHRMVADLLIAEIVRITGSK